MPIKQIIIIIILLFLLIIILKNKENFDINNSINKITKNYRSSSVDIFKLNTTNTTTTNDFSINNFRGIIVAWSGSIDKIPQGWGLCDGTEYEDINGNKIQSPDLRSMFILGASKPNTLPIPVNNENNENNERTLITEETTYLTPKQVGDTGGEDKHILTINEYPTHAHDMPPVGAYLEGYAKSVRTSDLTDSQIAGTTLLATSPFVDYFTFGSFAIAGALTLALGDNNPYSLVPDCPEGTTYTEDIRLGARGGFEYKYTAEWNNGRPIKPIGGGEGHENLHPYLTLAYIIRIK